MTQHLHEKTVTVPVELFSAINDYFSIQALAKKCELPENDLRELIEKRLVTAIPVGESWWISLESLKAYMDLKKQEADLEEYKKVLEQKKADLKREQAQLEHTGTAFHCLTEMTDVAAWWLNQISYTIPDLRRRQIFLDICSGKDPVELANKLSITLGHLQYLYNQTFTTIRRKAKFLLEYRTIMYELYCEIRRLEIVNRNYEAEVDRLYMEVLERERGEKPRTVITEKAIRILSISLENLGFRHISIGTLKLNNIHTIEDLLRTIKSDGFKAITTYRNVGKKAVYDLKKRLKEMNVIDENEQSDLYKYL